MTTRRLVLILLSPLWLVLAALGLTVGMAVISGEPLAEEITAELAFASAESRQLAVLAIRAIMLPFQLIFIALVIGAMIWVIRHRDRFSAWVFGEQMAGRWEEGGLPIVLQPGRLRTLQQMLSSAIAIFAVGMAIFLILGQFIERSDLAVVIAALTSSLTWGARLPIGDFLGGISNIFENDLAVGDHIEFRQSDQVVDGIVENVNVQYLSVRALSGELTTIPFGELRVFRNHSRGEYTGVYAVFPVAARDFNRAANLLTELAPQSTALLPALVEPWQPMSLEGDVRSIIDLCLFGKTTQGQESELALSLHALVLERLANAGIPLNGKESSPE